MIVIDFTSKRFNEIPGQDNPVFQTTRHTGEVLRLEECIIVCKVGDIKSSGVGDGFTVIHVPIKGEIVSKGRFWKIDMAMVFADAVSGLTMQYLD